MTNRLVHLAATARHLPMTERDTLHEADVRSMQRGLRGLAARGISGRPTGFRPKYSPSALRVSGAASPRIMLRKSRLDSV
jgi:hypothetical protein